MCFVFVTFSWLVLNRSHYISLVSVKLKNLHTVSSFVYDYQAHNVLVLVATALSGLDVLISPLLFRERNLHQ